MFLSSSAIRWRSDFVSRGLVVDAFKRRAIADSIWPLMSGVSSRPTILPITIASTISLQNMGLRAFFKTAKAASICNIFLSVVLVAAGFFAVVALTVFGGGCFLAAGFFAEVFLAGAVLVAVVVFFVAMFVFPLLGVSTFRVGHRGQRDHTVTSVSTWVSKTHPALSGHNSRNFFTPEKTVKNAGQRLNEMPATRPQKDDFAGELALLWRFKSVASHFQCLGYAVGADFCRLAPLTEGNLLFSLLTNAQSF